MVQKSGMLRGWKSWIEGQAAARLKGGGALLVTAVGFFTYFLNFGYPPFFFWDENYHIAAAQKYLASVYFMEMHPPLGKLLIALGEGLLKYNSTDYPYTVTDYATNPPPGFQFAGYRLFPTIFAWFTAPLMWLLCFALRFRLGTAILVTGFYLFDNALIVHSRGAMLEGILLFFVVLTLWATAEIYQVLQSNRTSVKASPKLPSRWLWVLGLGLGGAISTKVLGLILAPLGIVLFLGKPSFREFFCRVGIASGTAIGVFLLVWGVHVSRMDHLEPKLNSAGYYKASPELRFLIDQGRGNTLEAYPYHLKDWVRYFLEYQEGVPRLNYVKKDENGAPPYLWPMGVRSINYRWETPDGQEYRYLFLQSNPIVWGLCLWVGLLGSFSYLFSNLFFGLTTRPRKLEILWASVAILYLGYMISVIRIGRVMYLYHYFIPLILSMLLFGFVWDRACENGRFRDRYPDLTAGIFALVLIVFLYFSPLTYYQPLTNQEMQNRSWIQLWNLRCARCVINDGIVIHPAL